MLELSGQVVYNVAYFTKEVYSLEWLKQLYRGYSKPITEEIYIEGMIVSSDQDGNLSRSLIVQDATGGIEIRVGVDDLYQHFERGTTLLVRCNTLTLSDYGGSVQLEGKDGPIPEEQLRQHLRVTNTTLQDMLPQLLAIEDFTARWVNCWVRIEGVRVVQEELGSSWGDTDRDVDRHLVDARRDTLVVRVNASSEWAGMPIKPGSGAIEGILTYFNGYQLRPLSAADIQIR